MNTPTDLPRFEDVRAAASRIRPHVHHTPVLRSRVLDSIAGAQLFFKCENFQRSGSFKARGAHNAVLALADDQAGRGVVTHSSGNHGAAVALAARVRGISAHVVVPDGTVMSKVENIRRLGARLTFCEPNLAHREAVAARIVSETGAHFVHGYDDPMVIAGQGTAAAELLAEHPLDAILAPVGGGGLLSGTALAAKGTTERIQVFGAEPECADDARRSLHSGSLVLTGNARTIADGLRGALSSRTYAVIARHVEDILAVGEEEIVGAQRLIWSILKITVEPSSAVALAAVLGEQGRSIFANQRVGIILTGGNVDLDVLPWQSGFPVAKSERTASHA